MTKQNEKNVSRRQVLKTGVAGLATAVASTAFASAVAKDGGADNNSGTNNYLAREEVNMSAETEANKTLGLGIVGLIVRDLAASLGFYRQLGLDIPADVDGGTNYRMQSPNGQIFFWDTYEVTRGYDPDWQPSKGHRRVVLEFGFPTPEAVDAKHAEFVSAGYESYLEPFSLGATRYALIKDPDGNEIGLRYPLAS